MDYSNSSPSNPSFKTGAQPHTGGAIKSDPSYNGAKDAEFILEKILCRREWTFKVRDELADKLVDVVRKQLKKRNVRF